MRNGGMRSGFTAHVSAEEWRWVLLVSLGLLLLAFAPFMLLLIRSNPDWQFMGVFHNARDAATYLSKMNLGAHGDWLVRYLHTPEDHSGAFVAAIYPFLGQVAAIVGAPLLLIYHVARATASLFMYLALYQMAAAIWMRIRTRRIFFILAALGSGFGWVYTLLTNGAANSPDLLLPEAFPFYSSLVNVHFPLTITCLALLVGIVIETFRPGVEDEPRLGNNGLSAVLLSLLVAVIYPQSLVPLCTGLVLYLALDWWQKKKVIWRQLSWLLVIALPVAPLALYYGAVVTYNPAMSEWTRQNVTPSPSPLLLFVGFGLPLLIALPGIFQSLRQFSSHDDRFMLLWLLAILVVMYLPTSIQRRFAVGMMLPLAYFATRAVESVWFNWVQRRRWRNRVLILLVPLIALTNIFVLFVPTLPLLINRPEQSSGLFLERDYREIYDWLAEHSNDESVVLAAEDVSLWLPSHSLNRVVYGHPFETLEYEEKAAEVEAWYSGESNCTALLEMYRVDFVIYGPQEANLGDAPCLTDLQEVTRSGEVTLYAT